MKRLSVLLSVSLLVIVALSPAVRTAQAQPFSAIYFDPFDAPTVFDDFSGQLSDHWTVFRGSPATVNAAGRSNVLQMSHPQTGGALGLFGDPKSTSSYLTNPSTITFADGMIEFDIYFATNSGSGQSANIIFRMQASDQYYSLRLTSTPVWTCYFARYFGCCDNFAIIGSQSSPGAFQTGTWSHVVVTIGGPRFEAYKDGVLICQAEDNIWQRGTYLGLGILNNYYSGVFYISNFNIPGRFQWNVYRGSPGPNPGQGRIAPSWMFDHPAEGGDEAPFADGSAYSAYVSTPKTACFTNGVIEFDVLFANNAGQKAFLVFRMQDDSNYYGLRLTSTGDWKCHFTKFKGFGNVQTIGTESSQGQFSAGVWSHIKVVINGSHFECYKDGSLICSVDDPEWSMGQYGGIGFYSAYLRGMFFIDNLKICVY